MAAKPPAAVNKQLGLDELASQYGYAAHFFANDAELWKLINDAVRGQWTADKFRAAFMSTTWYRTKSASVREWSELQARDPAEVTRRVADQSRVIQEMADQAGISLDPSRLAQMARDSLMFGWREQQLQQAVAAEFRYKPDGGTQGQAASLEVRVRQMADDFGVNVSNSQMRDWIGGSLAGRYTEDHLTDFIRDMARSKYAGLAGYLDSGFNVRQVAAPYVQSYAQILEVPTETVSLADPKLQQALQGLPPKDGGMPAAMSLYDFERNLRKDPRWLGTKNARQSITDAGIGVLRDMGIYG